MEFFRIKRDIPFMQSALLFNAISLITFVLAAAFLLVKGLNFGVDFTGGIIIEAKYSHPADLSSIRETVGKLGLGEVSVQNFGTSQDVLIRLPVKSDTKIAALSESVFEELCKTEVEFSKTSFQDTCPQIVRSRCEQEARNAKPPKAPEEVCPSNLKRDEDALLKRTRVESVGPQVGKELAEYGALALLFVSIGIVIYLAFRFEWKFAVATIIANLHDIVIILGFFAFFQWEFSLPVLAAVLAVLGYSVNESVVIADRIRENFRKMRKASVKEVINNAITTTLSRTIITHGTTQIMVTSMLIFGGETLFYFALALSIGILFGIYSSALVMAALVMWLGVTREDLVKEKKKDGFEAEKIVP